jgi:hypothetical protein
MQIRLVRSPGTTLGKQLGEDLSSMKEGDEIDVTSKLANELLNRGLAEKVMIHAVPPSTVEKATEDLETYREKAKRKKDE